MKSVASNDPFNSSVVSNYMVIEESTKATESEAIIHYDFTQPKQYIIYNQHDRNERNNQSRGILIMLSLSLMIIFMS